MKKEIKKDFMGKILLILAGIFLVSFFVFPSAPARAEGEPWENDEYDGLLPTPEEEENIPFLNSGEELGLSLPSSYDSRNYGRVTSVKNQYNSQNCWSFATMAAIESGLLSRGYSAADLSELHYVHYAFTKATDPLGGWGPDQITYKGTDLMQQRGNATVTYHAITGWKGPVNESLSPFPPSSVDPGFTPSTQDAFLNDAYHLQYVYKININDTASIKKAIMDYGAVTTGFYSKSVNYNRYSWGYYSGKDNQNGSNHAVTIVGWNDNYSRYNFNSTPDRDGAWLIKNSWGSGWGDSGYFWISYAENSLSSTSCAFLAEPANKYDYCYQYDGTHTSTYRSTSSSVARLANVFTISGDCPEEEVRAVSFDILSTNTSYEIQVYTNMTNSLNPTSGTPMLSTPVTGVTTYAGFYTVSIPAIKLPHGTKYAVVVTLRNPDGITYLLEGTQTWGNTDYVSHADPYQSLANTSSTGSASSWRDEGLVTNANLRIKAFTKKIEKVYPTKITLNASEVKLVKGNPYALKAKLTPSNTTETNITWTTDRPDISQVSNGTVDIWGGGKITVTAKTVNGLTAKCVFLATVDNDPTNPFADVETGGWQFNAAKYVYDNSYMSGKGELVPGKILFDPNAPIDRSQFVQTLYNVEGKPSVTYVQKFTDVKSTDWFAKSVTWAANNGIVAGNPDHTFGVYNKATREQMARMFYAYATYKGYDTSIVPGQGKRVTDFTDADKVSSWAVTAMNWALSQGIMSGKGDKLDPTGSATRVECATMLRNFMNKIAGTSLSLGCGIDIDAIDAVEPDDVEIDVIIDEETEEVEPAEDPGKEEVKPGEDTEKEEVDPSENIEPEEVKPSEDIETKEVKPCENTEEDDVKSCEVLETE